MVNGLSIGVDDGDGLPREAMDNEGSPKPPRFYACYLLASSSPAHRDNTYVGFTNRPARRIRQHNGELTSGAATGNGVGGRHGGFGVSAPVDELEDLADATPFCDVVRAQAVQAVARAPQDRHTELSTRHRPHLLAE